MGLGAWGKVLPLKSMNFHKPAVCVPGTACIHSPPDSCATSYQRALRLYLPMTSLGTDMSRIPAYLEQCLAHAKYMKDVSYSSPYSSLLLILWKIGDVIPSCQMKKLDA